MFVVRNSANLIPNAANYGNFIGKSCRNFLLLENQVTTEPAALELAVKRGGIQHVIVCGHSDCKAINTLFNLHKYPDVFDPSSPMDNWLRKHVSNLKSKFFIQLLGI
jgi:carbonic anhydrase